MQITKLAIATFLAISPLFAQNTIVDVAGKAGNFNTLLAAAKAAGLAETLAGKGPFTVFAPTDEAFGKLGKDTIADLLKPESKDRLKSILMYHVVAGRQLAKDVVAAKHLASLQGGKLQVQVHKDEARIGGAKILKTDIDASNGVIHVIDSVMLPPAASAEANGAKANIVEVASKAGKFETLLAAAKAAGLAETLAGKGPFTVFAPTDEAFAKLGKDAIADLLKPENKQKLTTILQLHVVSGTVMAEQAVRLDSARTVGGESIALKVVDGKLQVGNATVVKADVAASNGVIHVIDQVILPLN